MLFWYPLIATRATAAKNLGRVIGSTYYNLKTIQKQNLCLQSALHLCSYLSAICERKKYLLLGWSARAPLPRLSPSSATGPTVEWPMICRQDSTSCGHQHQNHPLSRLSHRQPSVAKMGTITQLGNCQPKMTISWQTSPTHPATFHYRLAPQISRQAG